MNAYRRPHYGKIDKHYVGLPLSIEVDAHELIGAMLEELPKKFRTTALKALIHVGKRYNRPTEFLEEELRKTEKGRVNNFFMQLDPASVRAS